MSFQPLEAGINSSLLGTGVIPKVLDVNNQGRDLYPRRINYEGEKNTVFVIVLSAIVFVTIISFFDLIRNIINYYFSKRALNNPQAQNTQQDINSTVIANKEGIYASIVFLLFCIILSGFFFAIFYDKIINL